MKDYNHENFNGVPYTMHCFIVMQFAANFYTVIPYQALFRLPVYKDSVVGRSGAFFLSFCKIRDSGSPTIIEKKTDDFEQLSVPCPHILTL